MYAKAQEDMTSHTKKVTNFADFCGFLEQKNILLAPFCGDISCEDKIKADSARGEEAEPGAPAMGAKSLCIPFDQPAPIAPAISASTPAAPTSPSSTRSSDVATKLMGAGRKPGFVVSPNHIFKNQENSIG